VEHLYQTLKPFYNQIPAYVRSKLRRLYPDQFTVDDGRDDGLIPAHLLGKSYIAIIESTNEIKSPIVTGLYMTLKGRGAMVVRRPVDSQIHINGSIPEKRVSIDVTEQFIKTEVPNISSE